ncbi:MAG: MOSC domain-containing protein [Actinobacteria bacterium]|nr:MOSC domain-containing protein [Actinomycetota bacterium]
MRVGELWRYPAKSMGGERIDGTELTSGGVLGDRGWAVRDEVRRGIRGAKKIAGLMGLAARFLEPPALGAPPPEIEITLPDGSAVRSNDATVHERLSATLDHPVTLWPLQADPEHYRRGAADSDDLLEELRGIFGREQDEPLPDLSVFPPELVEYESPPGTYFDAYPLLLVTDRSLATLQHLTPSSRVDIRRFRPNVLVTVGDSDAANDAGAGFPEQAWIGRSIMIGGTILDVVAPCPRCVMITRGFADLPEDRGLLRTVVRDADQNLGVYATVRTPGPVTVGEDIRLV